MQRQVYVLNEQVDDDRQSQIHVVLKQQYVFRIVLIDTVLEKGNMCLIPTFTDEHNIKLNSAVGIW